MKERPILFSAPMVRAILDGTKTQTRRVVKVQPPNSVSCLMWNGDHFVSSYPNGAIKPFEFSACCPYGNPGDRLWVRETFSPIVTPENGSNEWVIAYGADGAQINKTATSTYNPILYNYERWKPSIHMPRWASRITLEIVSVRVERLNDISEKDAECEGIAISKDVRRPSNRILFRSLWESINGEDSWDANPLVWVIEFKRIPQ